MTDQFPVVANQQKLFRSHTELRQHRARADRQRRPGVQGRRRRPHGGSVGEELHRRSPVKEDKEDVFREVTW